MNESFILTDPREHGVPPHLCDGIRRYAVERIAPGAFLRACFENDLYCAVVNADLTSFLTLHQIILFIHGFTPVECRGSIEKVNAWLRERHEKKGEAS
jgi:hypothetical protein